MLLVLRGIVQIIWKAAIHYQQEIYATDGGCRRRTHVISPRTCKLLTENARMFSSNNVYLLLILSNFHYMNLLLNFDDMNRLRSDPRDTETFV